MSSTAESLADQLQSSDVESRRSAADQLLVLGEEAAPAAVALVRAVADEDEAVREAVAGVLEGMGPPRGDLSELVALCGDEHPDVAYWAVTLIGRLKSEASEALPALEVLLATHDAPHVRERAAWALGNIGVKSLSTTNVLKAAATSSNARLARLASDALRQIES